MLCWLQETMASLKGVWVKSSQLCPEVFEDMGGVGIIPPRFFDPVFVKEILRTLNFLHLLVIFELSNKYRYKNMANK
jgi:hypothetical protein